MATGLGFGLNGSAIQFTTALSPGHFAAAGSTNPSNLSEFTWGILEVHGGCISTGFVTQVERSGTSNGTFGQFGASIAINAACPGPFLRAFPVNTSAVWHRVVYTNGTGSANVAIGLLAMGARKFPVDQTAGRAATVWADAI